MLKLRIGLTVACLLCGSFVALAASPASADLADTVKQLVRQLDAQEKARRDDAERQLLGLGSVALPMLPSGDDAPPEVKLRLERVRTQLETMHAEDAVKAREVSLPGGATPLAEVLATIQEQTGDTLLDYRRDFGQAADPQSVRIKLEKGPFWPSLDQLLDSVAMTIYPFAEKSGLALVNRAPSELPRYQRGTYAGAFRIEATEVTARRDLRNPAGQSLRVQVEVAWEPRLAPIAISLPSNAIQAVADNGDALPVGPDSELEMTVNPGDVTAQAPLLFGLPSRAMNNIATLKGTLEVLLPGPVETFRFEDLLAGARGDQRRAGVKLLLEQVRRNNQVWEVRVRLIFDDPGRALESHRTWVLHNEALLETPDKKQISFAGMETTRQTENEVGVAYLFDVADIAGHTFVYKTPTVVLTTSVPFELRNIPLP